MDGCLSDKTQIKWEAVFFPPSNVWSLSVLNMHGCACCVCVCVCQMCCDCCLLGKTGQEQGLPCDHSLSLGYQCGLVYRACCVDGVPDNQTAPTGQTERGYNENIKYVTRWWEVTKNVADRRLGLMDMSHGPTLPSSGWKGSLL